MAAVEKTSDKMTITNISVSYLKFWTSLPSNLRCEVNDNKSERIV